MGVDHGSRDSVSVYGPVGYSGIGRWSGVEESGFYRDYASLIGQPDSLGYGSRSHLLHDPTAMHLDRLLVDAKVSCNDRDPGEFIGTILLGVAGALVGGLLGRAFGLYRDGDAVGFVMAVLRALVLLVLYSAVVGRTRPA